MLVSPDAPITQWPGQKFDLQAIVRLARATFFFSRNDGQSAGAYRFRTEELPGRGFRGMENT